MTSVINRRSQFEKGVDQLNTEIESLKKQVTDHEVEITKLNTELESQKETFEKASKVVKEYDALKENNKMILEDLSATTIDRNTKPKELDELRIKLSRVEKKAKRLARKLEQASSRESDLQVGPDQFLEGWKWSPEGLTFLGQMASRSYRLAVKETKERLKGILTGPDSSLDWREIEVEFDARIAEEERQEAERKAAAEVATKNKDAPQGSASNVTPSKFK